MGKVHQHPTIQFCFSNSVGSAHLGHSHGANGIPKELLCITPYLLASEFVTVADLELSNCLMRYGCGTLKNAHKILVKIINR
jgi:hypothetical protein